MSFSYPFAILPPKAPIILVILCPRYPVARHRSRGSNMAGAGYRSAHGFETGGNQKDFGVKKYCHQEEKSSHQTKRYSNEAKSSLPPVVVTSSVNYTKNSGN